MLEIQIKISINCYANAQRYTRRAHVSSIVAVSFYTPTHTHLYRRVVGAHFTFAFVYFRATTGLNFHLHFSKYLLALLMTTVSVASSEICMLVH